MTANRKIFNGARYISFLIKQFDGNPVYDKKYWRAKVKSYNEKINTYFHNNKMPKEGSKFICLLVTLISYVFKTGKNHYPQVFLVKFKYIIKKKRFIIILLMIYKFPLILMKTILMKKFCGKNSNQQNSSENFDYEQNSYNKDFVGQILSGKIQTKRKYHDEES